MAQPFRLRVSQAECRTCEIGIAGVAWNGGRRGECQISFAHCLQGEVVAHPQNPKDCRFDFHPIDVPSVHGVKTPARVSGYRSALKFRKN
ncbi:MAG: hypothetical protein QOI34_68 [Verrucomicrobiota bacterium]